MLTRKRMERRYKIEKELYKRALSEQMGRGGSIVPHPTSKENEQFLNDVAGCLLDLLEEFEELHGKTNSFSFGARLAEFRKDIVQKANKDFLAFVALIFSMAAFFKIFSSQVIKADIK